MKNTVITVGVDARPFVRPLTGIGHYSVQLFNEMVRLRPSWRWRMYLSSSTDSGCIAYSNNILIRGLNFNLPYAGTILSQLTFPYWAMKDSLDVFWSPRHHLPLLLNGRIKKCVTVHDLVWHRYPETMSTLGRYLDRFLMPKSVHMSDLVVSVSNSTQADLNEILRPKKQQAVVSPAPKHFANSLSSSERPSSESYFLFVGTNEPRKNIGRLLEAFHQALKSDISIRKLIVVGMKGWGRDELCCSIERLNLHSHVDVKNYLPEFELIDLYRNAHALVMPSLYEGFGMPLVEAMAFGVPVITSNCSSMPEVAGDAAIYVDPYSVDSIAFALKSMSDDKILRNKLSKNALVKASEYSWSRSAKKMVSLIEDCVRDS